MDVSLSPDEETLNRLTHAPGAAERNRLSVRVVESYESAILSGQIGIGERLPSEADIAKAFGISMRSVREALHVLETKGLVRRKHGERTIVVRDDIGEFMGTLAVTVRQLFSQRPDYFFQLMDVRRMIEVEIVSRLCDETMTVNAEVEDAIDAMRRAAAEGDAAAFGNHDAAFHVGLVRSVGNEILNVLYGNLFSLIVNVIRMANRVTRKTLEEAFAEHDEIYRLIKDKNRAGATEAMRRQIEGSAGYLARALAEKNEEGEQKR